MASPLRHHASLQDLHATFGADRFGQVSERFARAFGTPQFIICQTLIVAAWIALNVLAVIRRWDPYPFILLNLMFSTQAAYAAPLILLAQTRQADRDKAAEKADAEHREELASRQTVLIQENTRLTQQIALQTAAIAQLHEEVVGIRQLLTPTQPSPATRPLSAGSG